MCIARPILQLSITTLEEADMIAIELISHAWAALARMQQRRRERRQLAELDERLLRDIGVERADALREARKPFWRA
jgi:uncharacterized protein YjiS (DUF1127 family)